MKGLPRDRFSGVFDTLEDLLEYIWLRAAVLLLAVTSGTFFFQVISVAGESQEEPSFAVVLAYGGGYLLNWILMPLLAKRLERSVGGWLVAALIPPPLSSLAGCMLALSPSKMLRHDRERKRLADEREKEDERRKQKQARLLALADRIKEKDLLWLAQEGFVEVRARGQSIVQIRAQISNQIPRELEVVVNPGTCFVARGQHQNMVCRKQVSFQLGSLATVAVNIPATCVNASRPIPGTADEFYSIIQVSPSLVAFLKVAQTADPMVVQAGVWAITDGYTPHQISQRLVSRGPWGTIQAITQYEIFEARRILDQLGIEHRL